MTPSSTTAFAAGALAMALLGAPAQAQLTPIIVAQPVIDRHPQPATVLSGEGAAFDVTARAVGGGFITQIVWRDGSGRVVQASASSSLGRARWTAADAGDYTATVHHSNGTSITSRPARLTVRANGWAPLGGRALPWPASARTPALDLCGEPTVAWVEATATGQRDMRVHRFDGVRWRALGGSLMAAPTNSPNEPSLQCLPYKDRPEPVLAFSEAWKGGGGIAVKHWDGQTWVPIGQVNANPGAFPRMPVLRVRPHELGRGLLPRNSWLVWQEGSVTRAAAFGLTEWHDIPGGWQTLPALDAPLLALDSATQVPEGITWAPMIAGIRATADGNLPRVLQYGPPLGWVGLGRPPAGPAPGVLQAVGIGFSNEIGGKRAVMAWTEGRSSFTLRSASLAGAAYDRAIWGPYPLETWGAHADAYTGTDLQATAFDPQPFDLGCGANGPHAFSTALATTGSVQVLMSRCFGGGSVRWVPVAPALPVQAVGLALKMAGHDTPLVATVGPSGFGDYALTVWKYRP